MASLIARKLALMLVLLSLLNVAGFWAASTVLPATMRAQFSLDYGSAGAGFVPTYAAYLAGLLDGDIGSNRTDTLPRVVATPLRNSLVLLCIAFLATIVLGPALGVASLSPRTDRISTRAQVVLTVGAAVPGFFFGSLVIAALIFLARSGWTGRGVLLPVQGYGLDAHLVLPVLTLALRPCLYVANITASLLEGELTQDYIRVAVSKGVSRRALLWRHAVPNIVAPVTTALGQATRMLVSGLILVEALFDWRGLGWLLLQVIALDDRNQPTRFFLEPALLALLVTLFGLLLLLADLVASVVSYLADPRLRRSTEHSLPA